MAMEIKNYKAKVVVVGGGIAGSLVALSLQNSAEVVLIDPKEFLEITWATLRAKVEPSFGERIAIDHSEYLSRAQMVTSAATSLTENEVITADGHQLPYDYLVIATGNHDSVPKTRLGRLREYEQDYNKIKAANSVLIVGGGPTGVELAAEIAVDFPEKKVTLVHRGSRLLEFIGPKASQKALMWLTSKKVDVLLKESVNLDTAFDGVYTTNNGETIRADCHFVCIGKGVSSSWIQGSFLSGSLDNAGRLKVDENLRVKGYPNIFAVGDITDVNELKQGFLAEKHAVVASKNLKLLVSGQSEKKMSTYAPASSIAIVSLGRKEAVAQFPFGTMMGCLPGKIKSKDLFVGKTRKGRGLKSSPA